MTKPRHTAALLVILAGAIASLTLMFMVGRRNESRILMLLFTLWVLAPYVALFMANLGAVTKQPLQVADVGHELVVPLSMEFVALDVERGKLLIGNFDTRGIPV